MSSARVGDVVAEILPPALQRRLLDLPTLLKAWPEAPGDLRRIARPAFFQDGVLTLLVPDRAAEAVVKRGRARIRGALLAAAHLPRATLRISVVVNPVIFEAESGGNPQ